MDPYDLKREIVAAYLASGNQLGWRLLYSPIDVLAEAEVAFLGMHPGGREISPDHAEFAMESGSAYVHESWAGSAPGESRLQKQVRQLFGHLGQEPAQVLAGNLVPFRSPDWNSLQNRKASLEFGVGLWRRIFHVTTPKLVIGSGTEIARPLADILGIRRLNEVNVGWGAVQGRFGSSDATRLVVLPQLSRFSIVGRQQSIGSLRTLFGPHWGRSF